jgi:hypothetical protein
MTRTTRPIDQCYVYEDPKDPKSCWLWTRGTNGVGYGTTYWRSKTMSAHVVLYTMYKGEIPDGCELDHLCRNRLCVNPEHLEAVPRRVNLRRGKSTKLTEIEVIEIKNLLLEGRTYQELGRKYYVAKSTIQAIANGTSWSDILVEYKQRNHEGVR